jgi:RNA-directed DNA polymerase
MSIAYELSLALSLGEFEITRIIQTAPARYRSYPIEKKAGGDPRVIAQPASELKAVQRHVAAEYLCRFPVHDAAMAYVRGRGIVDNASLHVGNTFLLKLDFEKFFPSIKTAHFRAFMRKQTEINLSAQDLHDLEKILFWSGVRNSAVPRCLSIGAPTSPMISNILMYDIDVLATKAASELGVVYSRYADDIAASGNSRDSLQTFEAALRRIVARAKGLSLTFNDRKRGLYGPGQRRFLTGLVLTPTSEVSIGRDRKREIKALLHQTIVGTITEQNRGYLKGMLGFSAATEPQFLTRLRAKYGDNVVTQAMKYHVPTRELG